jgi:VWFA-related protein
MTRPLQMSVLCVALGIGTILSSRLSSQDRVSGFQQLYVSVVDAAGKPQTDLVADDFAVYDNGQKAPVVSFSNTVPTASVLLLFDTSGSMTLRLTDMSLSAERLINLLPPGDRVRIATIADRFASSPAFTSDRGALTQLLRGKLPYGNATHLFDGLFSGIELLAAQSDRRILVVFTDGNDNGSQRKIEDVTRLAQTDDAMLEVVALENAPLVGKPTSGSTNHLGKLPDETGGVTWKARTAADLQHAMDMIATDCHTQYVLGLAPDSRDGKKHDLRVLVRRSGTTVRARKSYWAAGPTTPQR